VPLRLYADECVDARIVTGLRRRTVDVVSAADEKLLGAADAVHLARAIALARVVLTGDADFLALAHQRVDAGGRHPGIIFILPRSAVGDVIRAVALVVEALEPSEIDRWIEWVP
jgi:predicted nuclease of predicted toxin-antitoxin system